jgi:D-glycero-alpha-D-manno-heptose-7-phosphate kinase
MTNITVKVPTRIDLAGGTIDLWPLHTLMEQASTVNCGITVYQSSSVDLIADSDVIRITSNDLNQTIETTYAEISTGNDLPLLRSLVKEFWSTDLGGIHLTTSCESPAGAGLGGSSCLSIAVGSSLIHAKAKIEGTTATINERELVETVQNVEAKIIHAPTGCQDYWGGVRGRVNILDFPNSGLEIETFHDDTVKDILDAHLIVAFSGKSRDSAMNNWQIFKNVFDGQQQPLEILTEIGKLANEVGIALKNQNVLKALELSSQEWEIRKKLWSGIETEETKRLDLAAKAQGAMFSRVCGAGGGGVMVFFAKPEHREAVSRAIEENGGTVMDAKISSHGINVSEKKLKRANVEMSPSL